MPHDSSLPRRTLLAATIGAALLLPVIAPAQPAWPTKPLRIIVPFAAGGGTDGMARALATKLQTRLGQPVIVENKGGSGGTIGTDFVAKALPDGHTLLLASTSITTNVASGKKLPYDLAKDLEPVGPIGASPLLVAVASDSRIRNLRDLVDVARAKPRSVNYGSGGPGAISHLGMELLADEAKVQFVHVPYKGTAPAITDLIAGHVQTLLASPPTATPHLSGGRIRLIAVTSAQRSPFLPNIPTSAESGVPGFQIEFWWGLLATGGTPPAVIKRLNEELNWALAQPEIRELLAREGATSKPGTPQDLARLIAFELGRWNKLVKEANIKME